MHEDDDGDPLCKELDLFFSHVSPTHSTATTPVPVQEQPSKKLKLTKEEKVERRKQRNRELARASRERKNSELQELRQYCQELEQRLAAYEELLGLELSSKKFKLGN